MTGHHPDSDPECMEHTRGIARRSVIAGGLALAAAASSGENAMAATWASELLTFAADLSGGDPEIAAAVNRYLASPPATVEEVGFYGFKQWSAQTRTYLGTVSLLTERTFIEATEDKYTWEILGAWQARQVIDVERLPTAGRGVFETIAKAGFSQDARQQEEYRRYVWENYAQATIELEQQIAASGRVLVSVDATQGDSLFFAFLSPTVANRWKERAFSEQGGYRAGVRMPMWDRFWIHLGVSLRGMLVDGDPAGFPPGTRLRNPNIPMIG